MSTKTVTVEDASPSPPPLLNKPPSSTATDPAPVDQPISSLGGDESDGEEDDAEEGDEEWDPAEERIPGQGVSETKAKWKGKGKAVEGGEEGGDKGEEGAHPWQAVWSPKTNAWYFWNTTTGEVTWTNPLETFNTDPSAPPLPSGPIASSSSSKPQARLSQASQFGALPEIDPALAFLLPPEARGGSADPTAQSAMFNARTGRFTANDYMYNVEHLDEYNRMKRMYNQYFDQDAWERDMAVHNAKRKREEEAGVAPKALSKKEMDRFRKMKQEKRRRNQAWLRD